MVLAPKSESKVKVEGTVYVMPKEFLLNLADGRYAKMTVALVLAPGQSTGGRLRRNAAAGRLRHARTGTAGPPDRHRQRSPGPPPPTLTSRKDRHHMQVEIRKEVDKTTDVKTKAIVFSDLVVQ